MFIKDVYESRVKDAGGDREEGGKRLAKDLKKWVKEKKLVPSRIDLQQMLEAMVYPGLPEGRMTPITTTEDIAEAATASGFPYATSQAIDSTAIAAYELNKGDVDQLVHLGTSKRKQEEIVGVTAMDEPEEIQELNPYPETIPGEKRWQVKNRKVGNIVSLSKELVLMDQTNEIIVRAAKLGNKLGSLRHKWIIQAVADIGSWTGVSADNNHKYNGGAVAIYANDHSSTIDGQTNDNIDGTNPFGSTGLSTLKAFLNAMVDEKGELIEIEKKILLVPPELEDAALKAVRSSTTYDDANSSFNVTQGRYKIVTSGYLTSAVQYYLGDPAAQYRWNWVWRPMVEKQGRTSEKAFSNDIVARWKVSMYGGIGALDYRFMARGGV